MRHIILAALLATPAMAETVVARGGGAAIYLTEKPCQHAQVLEAIKPEFHAKFRAGWATIRNESVELCWTADRSTMAVAVVFPDGDTLALPIDRFTRAVGV